MGIPIEHVAGFATVGSIVVGSTITLTWRLSREFSKSRGLIFESIKELKDELVKKIDIQDEKAIERLNAHERQDESRHVSLSEQLHQIQIRNAAQDGMKHKAAAR